MGTDRSYPKTRDNVVPYTNVGLNTTVTFTDLDLKQHGASTYYVTVRAHSASFSTAEVTSTGVNVGVDSSVIGEAFTIFYKRQQRKLAWTMT